MLAELECKNLLSNFASQKVRKINLIEKKYKFIIKYNKRPHLKLSPRAPKFIELALFYVLSQKRKRKSKNIVLFSLKNFTSDCLSHVILHNKIELANYVANHNCSHKFLISSCFGILHL